MKPALLSSSQLQGLLRIGDILIPGDDQLPSFSGSRCAEHADRMFAHMTDADRQSVRTLLGLFRLLPRFGVRGIFALTEKHQSFPEPLAGILRMANIGIKGVVMTLYYSGVDEGERIHQLIGWDAKIVERPG